MKHPKNMQFPSCCVDAYTHIQLICRLLAQFFKHVQLMFIYRYLTATFVRSSMRMAQTSRVQKVKKRIGYLSNALSIIYRLNKQILEKSSYLVLVIRNLNYLIYLWSILLSLIHIKDLNQMIR